MIDPLEFGRALRERGFAVRFEVVIPTDDTPAPALDHSRMTDCRFEGIDDEHWMYVTPSHEAAAYLLERFTQHGEQVFVRLGETQLCAYDPDDPARGGQTLERLRVDGEIFFRERGILGALDIEAVVEHPNHHELIAAIDERIAAWADAGLHPIADEREAHERLSTREPTLEARVRASSSEERPRESAVYGDWLETRGDPRGLLAAAALARGAAREPSERDRWQRELEHLERLHCVHLFGFAHPLAELVERRWDGPTIASLTIASPEFDEQPNALHELLATPPCACLRELSIVVTSNRMGFGDLAAAACAAGLRRLRVKIERLTMMTDAFCRLEDLEIETGRLVLGPSRMPALRRLEVRMAWTDDLRDCFAKLDTPALEHFDLALTTSHLGSSMLSEQLIAVLAQPGFSRLRSFRWATPIDASMLDFNFAEGLLELPALATLERIDLRDAALDAGSRSALEHHRDRLPGLLLP